MPKLRPKHEKRYRRHKRLRARIIGTSIRPRLCVFRSVKHIYAQLIDDERGRTLLSARDSDLKIKPKSGKAKVKKTAIAFEVGKEIAKRALGEKIKKAVFDRGGYKYHGRVKALSEGAVEGGLKF